MAKAKQPIAARRIRKAAPTVREKIEQSKPEIKSSGRFQKLSFSPKVPARAKSNIFNLPIIKQVLGVLRFITPRYFVNSWRELRQVAWPSGKETRRLTLAVFIFAVVFGTMVAIVDKGLDEFFKKVVLK